MTRRFANRTHAGRELADLLAGYAGREDLLVLALPRGGVPVAEPIAAALGAPLDVLVVRKLGVPSRPELAMGAIADVGADVETVRNERVLRHLAIPERAVQEVFSRERAELARRVRAYRGDRPPYRVEGRTVIVVDDGLATGSTMRAAVAAVLRQRPRGVVVAVPVGATDTCRELAAAVDQVICARTPEPFVAVRQGYDDFGQTEDDEVVAILARARSRHPTMGVDESAG